jgi:hypothetical protein
MNRYTEEQEEITFSEPIIAQKAVRCGITFVEKATWEVKPKENWTAEQLATMQEFLGKKYDACKLTITISDDTVRTEHEGAKPKLTIEDQFNIEQYPFPDKKTGALKKMGKQKLYELEQAFGFDPIFMLGNEKVEPHVTKSGAKVAPKIEGVKRVINPDFFNAYFTADGDPVIDNWVGKTIYADIETEKSAQFGDKNVIARYVKAPAV